MVGSLGIRATAAVEATSTVNWLIGSTVSAIGVGFLALISQAIGAGNRGKGKEIRAFLPLWQPVPLRKVEHSAGGSAAGESRDERNKRKKLSEDRENRRAI